jgi:hypothetical protein
MHRAACPSRPARWITFLQTWISRFTQKAEQANPSLLVEPFEAHRNVEMDNETAVCFVDTHSYGHVDQKRPLKKTRAEEPLVPKATVATDTSGNVSASIPVLYKSQG